MKISQLTGTVMLDAVKAMSNNGFLILYSGTQPTNPDTALSGNTALATFTFSASAFGADSLVSAVEQATASFVSSSVTASANGTATFARMFKSDGTTVIADLSVGTGVFDVNISSTNIVSGGTITLSSFLDRIAVD